MLMMSCERPQELFPEATLLPVPSEGRYTIYRAAWAEIAARVGEAAYQPRRCGGVPLLRRTCIKYEDNWGEECYGVYSRPRA